MHKIKRLSEMARESQMTRPTKDTPSTFRQPLAFNRAQQGPTLRSSERLGFGLLCVGQQTQVSRSRLRSGMKHLRAGLRRRLSLLAHCRMPL
jgi:hypothetical protein